MRLAIIGPAVKTTKPKSHGLRNANAAHVSRDAKPENQCRTLTRGPGTVAEAVAIDAAGRCYFLAALIAATDSFCAWSSAAFAVCCPARTRLIASFHAFWNSLLAGEAGTLNEKRCTSSTFLTVWSKNGLIDVYVCL